MASPRLPQFNIYKGTGALQLNLLLPDFEKAKADGKYPQPGCVMLDICPSTGQKDARGNPTYNWKEDKITLKLNDKDVADILLGLQGRYPDGKSIRIIHDPNAGTGERGDKKFLEIMAGQREGTVFIRCAFGEKKGNVPVDANEIVRMRLILAASIPAMYGWH